MNRQAEGMTPEDHEPTTLERFEGFMRQILSAPSDGKPKSENRMPSSEELNRRYRFEPRS
ncbi:MAG: hypothetical protein F4X81_00905 [Gammaproteobacteria bacterium]|nr:hypothetical protein [Gammaproteobacteria bacterium]MYE50007.1 hypothetical protein [Gammaproteobacteria bacterium]MYH17146.1 hypothetical protein [Gammaproteobacteria bacterium]